MVDKETNSYPEDTGNVEDVTNELVVVVLQLLLGVPGTCVPVPAVPIVHHLLATPSSCLACLAPHLLALLSWSLKMHVCS